MAIRRCSKLKQLWVKFGYSSLFVFCQKCFNMFEAVAGERIGAMRTVRRFPVLLSMVERGELHLSGIQRLSAHLTCDNHQKVLAAGVSWVVTPCAATQGPARAVLHTSLFVEMLGPQPVVG